MVNVKDVIGIFDVRVKESTDTVAFLNSSRHHRTEHVLDLGDIKSIVVTERDIYYSPISSLTLKKRAQTTDFTAKSDGESL